MAVQASIIIHLGLGETVSNTCSGVNKLGLEWTWGKQHLSTVDVK
jgi:hypothetical protein